MHIPDEWQAYPCAEYCEALLSRDGYWDASAQLWLIESATGVTVDAASHFLQVGRPGVDGIGFGYRAGLPGFWAFHRGADPCFQLLSPSIHAFLTEWLAGRITV